MFNDDLSAVRRVEEQHPSARSSWSAPQCPRYKMLIVVRHPVGGIRTFMRYVYRRFDPRRYAFTLICPELPETHVLLKDLADLGLRHVPTASRVKAGAFARTVAATLWRDRFDLVHSHGFTAGLCAAPAALLRGTPHLMTCHDVLGERQLAGWRGSLRRHALSAAIARMDGVHCVTRDARDNLLKRLAPGSGRWRTEPFVIPNGIETQRFLRAAPRSLRAELGLPPDCFLIGFFGRFMSQKGFAYLVDAVARLEAERPTGRRPVLLTFGAHDGFIREEQAAVRRRGLSDTIRFLPFEADIAATLKGLDVVAMPSLWEACGLVAMEAMVAGVPLVGTTCVGLREVLHDTPAATVPPADSDALFDALAREMTTPTTAAARRFVAQAAIRFDVQPRAAALERWMIERLATGHAPSEKAAPLTRIER